jgi:hypothetical protein
MSNGFADFLAVWDACGPRIDSLTDLLIVEQNFATSPLLVRGGLETPEASIELKSEEKATRAGGADGGDDNEPTRLQPSDKEKKVDVGGAGAARKGSGSRSVMLTNNFEPGAEARPSKSVGK